MPAVTTDPPRARRLPPDAASAGQARRFVREVLGEWRLEGIEEVATLLVSEVVTNAVLHAGTDLTVGLRRSGGNVRVEVADRSTQAASRRHYDSAATTGRGLALVDALSDEWGVEARPDGKTVWFDVGMAGPNGFDRAEAAGGPTPPARTEPALDHSSGGMRPQHQVTLVGLPLALVMATAELGDALLREAALLALSGEPVVGEPSRWQAPGFDVTTVFEPARQALEQGHEKLDLTVSFPAEAWEGALRRLALIEEADRLAAEGELLSLPSLPEVAACRRWYLGEIARQLQGSQPSAWELPEPGEDPTVVAWLDESERTALERATGAVIVADGTNHIVFANRQAAELLGWTEEELMGRRLTTIVPPERREAHLAGYTRYQVTRQPRIIGTPVTLAALGRDGARVPVELTIDVMPRPGRPPAFVATLRQV